MQQAVRVSDDTAFFLVGDMVEFGDTKTIFLISTGQENRGLHHREVWLMRSKFDEQLRKLNEEMMHMGSMIEESIQKAIEAFIHQDADSAKAIMEGDSEIDREQKR